MSIFSEDTIAAISSAVTPSGIGIVRLSGSDALAIADKVYKGKSGKTLSEQAANTIHYGYVTENGETVDEALFMILKAPHSYTGEDTVEIDCHGGVVSMRKVLETVIHAGARPAEPGEYTKRAFLNGRIDLSQAEAVMDLIRAKNEYAMKNSLQQLKGSVGEKIRQVRKELLYEIAYIESALDDPEHISIDGYGAHLLPVVENTEKEIRHLLESADQGKIIQEGIKTVILGKPNAGKSSLLNYLLKEDRAIVTDIAGTTRDILEETVTIHEITLHILDTAGIHDADNVVEQIGIDRALDQAKDADLILYVADSSVPFDEGDRQIWELTKDKRVIVLFNKSDLAAKADPSLLPGHLSDQVISISAKDHTGLEQLEERIRSLFFEGELSFNDEIYINNARQQAALEEAEKNLQFVKQSILDDMPEDFFSIDLMGAYESLGRILGESLGEDLVNEIFSKFCTGK